MSKLHLYITSLPNLKFLENYISEKQHLLKSTYFMSTLIQSIQPTSTHISLFPHPSPAAWNQLCLQKRKARKHITHHQIDQKYTNGQLHAIQPMRTSLQHSSIGKNLWHVQSVRHIFEENQWLQHKSAKALYVSPYTIDGIFEHGHVLILKNRASKSHVQLTSEWVRK